MPDSFDPLMMLGTATSKGDPAAPAVPGDTGTSALPEAFDPASVSAANVQMPGPDRPLSTSGGFGGPPAGVDRFDGSRP